MRGFVHRPQRVGRIGLFSEAVVTNPASDRSTSRSAWVLVQREFCRILWYKLYPGSGICQGLGGDRKTADSRRQDGRRTADRGRRG